MELRLYSFVHVYMSPIQHGIQTGHAAVDLVRKYQISRFADLDWQRDMVADWADNHKTFIVLNGGNSAMLKNARDIISATDYPCASFSEDHQSMEGMLTCVSVILPEQIFKAEPDFTGDSLTYQYADDSDSAKTWVWLEDTPEYNLIKLIKQSKLA